MKSGRRAWGLIVVIACILLTMLFYVSSPRHMVADLTYIAGEAGMMN